MSFFEEKKCKSFYFINEWPIPLLVVRVLAIAFLDALRVSFHMGQSMWFQDWNDEQVWMICAGLLHCRPILKDEKMPKTSVCYRLKNTVWEDNKDR